MNRTYSESLINLSKLVRQRKFFRIKLPGRRGFYIPHYGGHIFLEKEIIVFEPTNRSSVFIGIIENVITIGVYKVYCIQRGEKRDPLRKVNWMINGTVSRKNILCELVKEQDE